MSLFVYHSNDAQGNIKQSINYYERVNVKRNVNIVLS